MSNTEKLYVVRGLKGEYAKGTKISATKGGASNSKNAFCDGIVARRVSKNKVLHDLFTVWKWYAVKDVFKKWDTLWRHLDGIGACLQTTEKQYNEFMDVVRDVHSYWHVEEIEQEKIK